LGPSGPTPTRPKGDLGGSPSWSFLENVNFTYQSAELQERCARKIAALAASEASDAAGGLPVAILAGGMKAWQDAKLAIEAGHTRMADPPTDVWYRPYDFKEDVEAAMRQYLDWEVDLVPQVKRDGDAKFAVFKPLSG